MITHKTGNVFDTDARIIAHGVNLQGDMSGGIAKVIAEEHPDLLDRYRRWCPDVMLGEVMYFITPDMKVIANVATQFMPGRNARLLAVHKGLHEVARNFMGEKIAMPQIGCGIGGLQWENVEHTLNLLVEETGADIEVWTL